MPEKWLSIVNMAFRGLSLVGRFALTFYMARYLNIRDVGTFGLLLGAVNIAPSILGLGLNFYLNREIIDAPPNVALGRIRDRLIISLCMSLGGSLLLAMWLLWRMDIPPNYVIFVSAIIVLEVIAFDIHLSLISLRRPLLANSLLFIRSSAWVFPAVLAGVFIRELRTLDGIMFSWIVGLVAYFCVLAFAIIGSVRGGGGSDRIDFLWLRSTVSRGWIIYLSDIGLVGQMFLDRFIIQHFLGLESTGIYTLHWTLANAVQVLLAAGILQVSLPALVSARAKGEGPWRAVFKERIRALVLTGTPLCLSIFVLVQFVLPRIGIAAFGNHNVMFAILILGIMLKCISDLINYGLYSLEMDSRLAVINMSGLILSALSGVMLTSMFGISGAAGSIVFTNLCLITVRLMALRKHGAL